MHILVAIIVMLSVVVISITTTIWVLRAAVNLLVSVIQWIERTRRSA